MRCRYIVDILCLVGVEVQSRILGRNWDKSLKSFPSCYSQSPLANRFYSSSPPPQKSGLKLVCSVNIVYGNLKSENSQDYAQKSQRNFTFMKLALVQNNAQEM